MKKIIIAATVICSAILVQAATVGWSNMGLASYNGDKYQMFVIGQKGVVSVATVTALLDAGTAVDAYSIGGGAIANGFANVASGSSGATISDQGTYTAFMVLFDAATPVSGTTKYAVLEGASGYVQTIGPSTATITFVGGNAASMVSAATWKTYGAGAAPEPTSGVLLLLGMAGLALKRKRA